MILELEMARASEELKSRYKEASKELDDILRRLPANPDGVPTAQDENDEREIQKLYEKTNACRKEILNNYRASFLSDPMKIIEDVKLILREITLSDFVEWLKVTELLMASFDAFNKDASRINPYAGIGENYKSAVMFLQDKLYLQVSILSEYNNDDLGELPELINKKAASWYKKEEDERAEEREKITSIVNIPSLVVSNEKFKNALAISPQNFKNELENKINSNAYIYCSNQISFIPDEDGNLKVSHIPQKLSTEELLKEGYNEGLFGVILAATLTAYLEEKNKKPTISINEFAKAIEIDIREKSLKEGTTTKHHGADPRKILDNNTKFMGVINGDINRPYKLFNIDHYDLEEGTVTFESPYCVKIIQELDANAAFVKADKKGNIQYQIKGFTDTVKSNIAGAKNKKTAAVIMNLAGGLARRGNTPDAKTKKGKKYKDTSIITYGVTFKSLIYNIPIIEDAIIGKSASRRSDILKKIFGTNKEHTLEEYIKKYTWFYDKYIDFNISVPVPSWTTIEDKIIITHRGTKGEFSTPYNLIKNN